MDTKVIAAGAIAAGAGVAQTFILREKVDRKYPTKNIPALKGFGYLSTIIGLATGGVGLAVGAIGSSKDGKTGRQRLDDIYNEAAIDYGATALVGGIMSGMFPAVTEADCITAGGYYYNGVCNLKPSTGATSLEGAPGVQTAAYKSPIPHLGDTDVYKRMTAEIQRLATESQTLQQENASLKSMAAVSPYGGSVPREQPSGFMATEPRSLPPVIEQYPVGHPEPGTRRHGFMGEAMAEGYGF